MIPNSSNEIANLLSATIAETYRRSLINEYVFVISGIKRPKLSPCSSSWVDYEQQRHLAASSPPQLFLQCTVREPEYKSSI